MPTLTQRKPRKKAKNPVAGWSLVAEHTDGRRYALGRIVRLDIRRDHIESFDPDETFQFTPTGRVYVDGELYRETKT